MIIFKELWIQEKASADISSSKGDYKITARPNKPVKARC